MPFKSIIKLFSSQLGRCCWIKIVRRSMAVWSSSRQAVRSHRWVWAQNWIELNWLTMMLAPIIRIALSLLLIQLLGAFRSQYHGIASPLSFTKCSLNGRTFKANDPLVGEIIHVKKLVSNSHGEVCEVLINHFEQMDFVEGQSIGIIPPGWVRCISNFEPFLYSLCCYFFLKESIPWMDCHTATDYIRLFPHN